MADGSLVAVAAGFVGIVGAAVAGLYQRFSTAGVAAETARIAQAVKDCEARSLRYEMRIAELETRLAAAQGERDVWKARYEWTIDSLPKSSPPRSETG
jgi:hypothetical protein